MGQKARWTLPLVVDPPQTVCVQIRVPKDIYHIAAFFGAIFSLSTPYSWENDPDHTAIQVGKVWRRIYYSLRIGNCDAVPTQPGSAGTDEGDFFMIRQNPDNPCLLESSVDGISWCPWADISLCQPSPSQPGPGTPQPAPGGGCQLYHGTMGAREPWYVPTVVSSGDTIEVSTANGAWNDGDEIAWRCFDGGSFFAGSNTGLRVFIGSDPLPSVPHMAMIALIDATYYDLSSGPVTVPGGISNAQVTLQPNDSPISDNAGTITFDITVCNNQAGAWTSILDFTISPYSSFISGAFASWAMGTGYQGVTNGGVPNWAQIDITLDPCDISSVTMTYDAVSVGGSSDVVFFQENATGYGTPGATQVGAAEIYSVFDAVSAVTLLQAICSTGTGGGADHIQKLVITGTGVKPGQLP